MTVPENAIPAGSLPPEQDPGQATKQAIDQAAKDNLILGKFKSADEVVPAYQALEQDHGRLGSEVGTLRKQNEILLNLVNKTAQQPAAQAQPGEQAVDYDKLVTDTANAVESGDLSVGEGFKKVAELVSKKSIAQAKQTYDELDSARNAKSFLDQFQKDHPDFGTALQSRALEAIKAQNPMHDNLSAYFEWKAGQAAAEAAQQVKDAYEKGKTDMAELAKGADPTRRVLGKSGSEARVTNTNTGPVTEAGKISGMMDVLKAVRAG